MSRGGFAVVIVAAAAVAVAAKKKRRRRSGYRDPGSYVERDPGRAQRIGTSTAAFRLRERLKRARDAYNQAVASGSKPIEGVGTAVAAFIGLAPGGPVNTP